MRSGTAVVLCSLVWSFGCGGTQTPPPATTAPTAAGAPTLDDLRNASYTGFSDGVGEVTLTDGYWEGPPYVEGAVSRPRVDLVGDIRLVGDVDADGSDEAVALLVEHAGGTGEYLYLAVVDRIDDGVRNAATALVGDRVQIRGADVEDGTVALDVVQVGPDDAMCCPGDLVTRRWTLGPDGLTELESVVTGRLGPDTLAGSEWVLTGWGMNEPVVAGPEITLAYEDGRFVGSSGCNRYFAAVSAGDTPGEIRIGTAGGTMMACPDDVMEVETRYLTRLGATRKMGFHVGRLALTSVDGDTLLFERQPTSQPDDGG
jgi:heat shock protein HslJ